MRLLFTLMMFLVFTATKAQNFFTGFPNNIYTNSLYNSNYLYDSAAPKKWFVTRSIGLTAGFAFFNGGNAAFTSVPVSFQLNRRLNNNLYAFTGVAVAPTYINFSNAFLNTNISKTNNQNNFFKTGNINTYSSAALGLMYVNDAKTFSISGSISVERNNYPIYNYAPVNATKQNNNLPVYR